MTRTAPVILAALALAACGQKTGTTTITSNSETGTVTTTTSGNPPTAASLGLQPGKWETTITVIDAKGLGPDVKSGPQKISTCITPEQAAKGPGDMLKGAMSKAKIDCTIKSSSFAGGKVSSEASCKLPTGAMNMKVDGTYSPTDVSYDTETTLNSGPVNTVTRTHTVAHRVGDCG